MLPQLKEKPWFNTLFFYTLLATVAGTTLGLLNASWALELKVLSDAFIKIITLLVPPVIFCSIVLSMDRLLKIFQSGKIGATAFMVFTRVSIVTLALGLFCGNIFQFTTGFTFAPADFLVEGQSILTLSLSKPFKENFLSALFPVSIGSAFIEGNILQVVVVSLIFGFSLSFAGTRVKEVVRLIELLSLGFTAVLNLSMYCLPFAALGASAFLVGKFGMQIWVPLLYFLLMFLGVTVLYVLVFFGISCQVNGYSIFKLIRYFRTEIRIAMTLFFSMPLQARVLGKLQKMGLDRQLLHELVPFGFTYNLIGTGLYIGMTVAFITEAFGVPMSRMDQVFVFLLLALICRGIPAMMGGGFILLAAVLAAIPSISAVPLAGIALFIPLNRFTASIRSSANLIGNIILLISIARRHNIIDEEKFAVTLEYPTPFTEKDLLASEKMMADIDDASSPSTDVFEKLR